MWRCRPARLPPTGWLVEDHFVDHGIGLLYGEPGAGKSLFALGLGLSVATGRPFFGHEVKQGRVAYLWGEAANSSGARIDAWLSDKDAATRDAADANFRLWITQIDLLKDEDFRDLADELEAFEPTLVIVDTVSVFGLVDLNDQRDMEPLFNRYKLIGDVLGAYVLAIHHPGKGGSTPAGSAVAMRRPDDIFFLKRTKPTVTLQCKKHKDSAPNPDREFSIEAHGDGAVFVPYDDTTQFAEKAAGRPSEHEAPILEALAKGCTSRAAIVRETGIPRTTVRRTLQKLVRERRIRKIADGLYAFGDGGRIRPCA